MLPDVKAYLGGEFKTDADLASFLLEKANVATIPGGVFEAHGHIRLSYAASREDITRGVQRIADAFATLST